MTLTRLTETPCVRSALLCSALVIPAMIPITALAQDQAEACQELEQAAGRIDFEQSDISQDEFNRVVQSNQPEQCETWLAQIRTQGGAEGDVTETERARVRLQDEVVIEGRVIVDQPQPEVQVEEPATEISVSNPSPDVNVSQGPIDIVIRQGAPVISLDMPQPTITIEQPAPEIIVTMPDPSVDVGNARPQIEVRQGEPRVQISMPEPSVELELYQAEDPESSPGIAVVQRQRQTGAEGEEAQAAVTMNRAEPQIIYQDAGQQEANVNVSRSEPTIRFEQAEPQVEIASSGEPQVNWSQSGEPTVRFQQAASEEGNQQSTDQSGAQVANQEQTGQEQTAQEQADPSQGDQRQAGGPNVRRQGYDGVEAQEIEVTELDGATLFGVRGSEIGEIGNILISDQQAETLIVDIGAMTESEERRVEIPFSDVTFLRGQRNGDIRAYIDASEDRLMSYPEASE